MVYIYRNTDRNLEFDFLLHWYPLATLTSESELKRKTPGTATILGGMLKTQNHKIKYKIVFSEN